MHIGFNMLLLYFMGRLLEPAIGWLRFTVLYFACLIAGSFVALWFSPDTVSAGASGAIFGVLGATFVIARGRQMEAIAGQIGFLIIFNLVFTFAESGSASGPTSRPRRRRPLRPPDRRRRAGAATAAGSTATAASRSSSR